MTELALIVGIGLLGLLVAGYLARWVRDRPVPEVEMANVAALVRRGAETFFRKQSGTISAICGAMAGAIFLAYGLRRNNADEIPALELGVWLTLSLVLGAASSIAAGHIAIWVSTRTTVRVASAAKRSVDQALQVALRGGAILGLVALTFAQLGLAFLFIAVLAWTGGFGDRPAEALRIAPRVPSMIVGYALGASFAALLAQLGGGTFSKSADIGADVAAREVGLGEDDPRNPATIADLAGDSVGDCAGTVTGYLQAGIAENLATMLAGAAVYLKNDSLPSPMALALFPLVTRGFSVLGLVFGILVVRTDDREDPMSAVTRGLVVNALLHAAGVAGAAKWMLGAGWREACACAGIGIFGSLFVCLSAQYHADVRYRPVRELAEASRGGSTLTLLTGFGTALEASLVPLAGAALIVLGGFLVGSMTGLAGGGTFGIALALLGMLGTSGYLLSISTFGAVADGARGVLEMTIGRERPDVLGRAVVLDSVGNTAKAVGRTHSATAALVTGLLLLLACIDEVQRRMPVGSSAGVVGIGVGLLFGLLLVTWFAARCVAGVTRTSRRLIDEVRRQLRDRPLDDEYSPTSAAEEEARSDGARSARGPASLDGPANFYGGFNQIPRPSTRGPPNPKEFSADAARPPARKGTIDHQACVEMAARLALRHMVLPAVLAAGLPVIVGLGLRLLQTEDNPRIAVDAVVALSAATMVAASFGSLLLGQAGGAWDNAKQYIVTGAHGGRFLVDDTGTRTENPTYLAALVADTVGDPLKETVAPALLVLVKMMPALIFVFLPFLL